MAKKSLKCKRAGKKKIFPARLFYFLLFYFLSASIYYPLYFLYFPYIFLSLYNLPKMF